MLKEEITQYCIILGVLSFVMIVNHGLFAQENVCCGVDWGKEYSSVKEVYESGNPVVWRDFSLQGEYTATFDGQNAGLHLVAYGEGKFNFVFYTGGLPGEPRGWSPQAADGWSWSSNSIRMFGRGEIKNDELLLTTERILSTGTVYPVQEVIKTTPYRFTFEPYRDGMVGGPSCVLERTSRGVIPLPKWEKVYRQSPTYGEKPPQGAFVLFADRNLSHFDSARIYEQPDGPALVAGPISKPFYQWKPFTFHAEFMTTYRPTADGQHRANSGIFLAETYEVQILDSFGLEPDYGDCGALYGSRVPDINVCYPPLVWQTFDIEFTPPRFEKGEKMSNSVWTIKHNGITIHENYEMVKKTAADKDEVDEPRGVYLQPGHANHVQFRNMWFHFQ